LCKTAEEAGAPLTMLKVVEQVNEKQKRRLLEKIDARLGATLSGKTIATWGLAFKPNTDDMREAPSRVVIPGLIERGAKVTVYDPVAMHEAKRIFEGSVRYADSPLACLDGADALVILTEWKEFRSPDFDEMKRRLRNPLIFDGRNLYDPALMKRAGFEYRAMGRH
jgi:UDPglucose 6-dehydrogenase